MVHARMTFLFREVSPSFEFAAMWAASSFAWAVVASDTKYPLKLAAVAN